MFPFLWSGGPQAAVAPAVSVLGALKTVDGYLLDVRDGYSIAVRDGYSIESADA